jgi:hypothetical protein
MARACVSQENWQFTAAPITVVVNCWVEETRLIASKVSIRRYATKIPPDKSALRRVANAPICDSH